MLSYVKCLTILTQTCVHYNCTLFGFYHYEDEVKYCNSVHKINVAHCFNELIIGYNDNVELKRCDTHLKKGGYISCETQLKMLNDSRLTYLIVRDHYELLNFDKTYNTDNTTCGDDVSGLSYICETITHNNNIINSLSRSELTNAHNDIPLYISLVTSTVKLLEYIHKRHDFKLDIKINTLHT